MTTINYLTQIEFEFGISNRLHEFTQTLGIKTPLLITDKGMIATGIVDQITSNFPTTTQIRIFDQTPSNPTEAAALDALQMYHDKNCDGVVAIGGGSSIDLAKAVALLATHKGPLAQYAAIEGGVGKIGAVAPLIALPTTSGTGSEVGRATLITLNDGRKLGLISPHIVPDLAICDPDLTLGLPAGLTAATGLDAISHCIETYLSPRINPVAEAIALDGLARAVSAIEKAVQDGSDKQARWDMMMASLQGGLTFQKGLGAIHALSHPLGGLKHVNLHHGTLNAIFLPPVLDYNKSVCAEKYDVMRKRLNLNENASLSGYFISLNKRLNLPTTLSEIGVLEDDLLPVSKAAVLDHSTPTNPRGCTADDYMKIMKAVF